MIKFFRSIRKNMIKENRTSKYLLYAIGEIVLVVIGILIALSINNWNEEQKENNQKLFILNKLGVDIKTDIFTIKEEINVNAITITNYKYCLDILSNKIKADKQAFLDKFSNILSIGHFIQNKTTFNNLISTGKIELIKNQNLSDSIVKYYNVDYEAWDTAMRDYTRNIIAPFLLYFDYIPQPDDSYYTTYYNASFSSFDNSQFEVIPKTLDDYKKEIFIINMLMQKIRIIEGQNIIYNQLLNSMHALLNQIENELK